MMVRHKGSEKFAATFFTFVILALTTLTSTRVHAQVSGATLTGTVADSSGAAIPNAELSIKNMGTGEARTVTSDSAGFYTAPNLLPGKYEVTSAAPGFSTAVRSGITLTVGAQQLLNISMTVGEVSSKVVVTGEAPAVQLASAEISGVVQQAAVVELPLNGRDWTSLATLQPGVEGLGSVQANTGSKDRARRGYGAQMSISGARPTQNNYRIDGINVNDYSNGGPGSVEGATAGVDAIQEFSVLTSNYSAEYGRTSGGVVNAITRSGANQFHGDVYEFLRNSALDADGFFDNANGLPKPPFRRNQFGGALGGPIRKDRTFFFVDYEGLRENRTVTTQVNVPSLAARGIGPNGQPTVAVVGGNPLPGPGQPGAAPNPDPVTHIDKAVLPYLGLWGPPQPQGAGDSGIYAFSAAHITSENFGTGRLDHKFSDSDSLFVSYQYDGATATQPDQANDVLVGNTTGREFAAIEENHIFSARLVNTARVGFNRPIHTGKGLRAINPLAGDPKLGESGNGIDHNPQIDALDNNLVFIQPGVNQVERIDYFHNSYQAYDDLFLTKGIHSFKIGFAVERIQTNVFNPAPVGEIQFSGLQAFLTNQPTVLFAPLPNFPFLGFGFRASIFGGYVDDDIRVRPNLTINLGLRYEMSTVPSEANSRLSVLRSPTDSTPHIGNGIFQNPTYRNFEPRIGFAWDPFGNGKTSVRGGFGMFDVLPLPYEIGQFATNDAPFTENGQASINTSAPNNLMPGDFPFTAFQKLVSAGNGGTGLRYAYVDPHPKRNYVMQWNVAVQHELLPNLTAMAAYVGSRGVHMEFRADDINTTQPHLTSAGYLFPGPSNGTTCQQNPIYCTLSPNVGQMDTLQWNNDSFFKGVELQIIKRMSHGFQVEGSYTWSKAVDGGDGAIASDSFLNSIPSLFYFLPKYRRGPADFDVRHNLTVNYMWQVPTPKLFTGPAAYVARGWQLGGILEVRSGLPFTPVIGGDPLGLSNTSAVAFPDRLTGSGCDSLVNPGNVGNYIKLQCFGLPMSTPAIAANCIPFTGTGVPSGTCSNLLGNGGRNEIYGPGLVNFDFSVFKDNKIRENLNLQFRAEFFNVFNHANFNSPLANSTLFNPDGSQPKGAGAFDSTSTTSREIQFALKLIF